MGLFRKQRRESVGESDERAELRSAVMELKEIGRELRETQERLTATVDRLEEETIVA